MKKRTVVHILQYLQKLIQKQIMILNITHKTSRRKCRTKVFLGTLLKGKTVKNDKLAFIEIKDFCSLHDANKRRKRQVTGFGEVFANHVSDKGSVSRMYKEFQIFCFKKQAIQF